MTDATYESLITEAFIDPIRSVLIVDDDYPTLDEILAEDEEEQECNHKGKKWHNDRKSVRDILRQFRDPKAPLLKAPLLLDIHDGTMPAEEEDEGRAGELQQTDLLILDYQLEPNVDHGEHALRIARRALSNDHFNLILVHTEKELDSVFFEFVTGLYEPRFQTERERDTDETVDSFEADYGEALRASLSRRHWAYALRSREEWPDRLCGRDEEWNGPRNVLESDGGRVEGFTKTKWRAAVIRAFAEMEAELPPHDCGRPVKVLDWQEQRIPYIRTDRGFMAFRSKKEDPKVPLLRTVEDALSAWCPRPSRLLLTKLRAEMDKRGIEVQDAALGTPDIGAIWYRELLGTDETQVSATVDRTVRNHAEQLLDQILPGVRKFARKMTKLEEPNSAAVAVKKRFRVDLTQPDAEAQAVMAHNAFVGSKPVSGSHLELGHILAIDGQMWLCITPACDLVPGRKGGGNRPDKGGGLRRFSVLHLLEPQGSTGQGELLSTATRGGRIFANLIQHDGTTHARVFQMASKDNALPTWFIMYAENDGVLTMSGEERSIGVRYVNVVNGDPEIARFEALVVGHLRPEYALDVQARLTGTQSRIGLDLMGLSTEEPVAE